MIIEEASEGFVRARLTLASPHVNKRGSIHGAVTAALIDWSGSLAIASHGMDKTGPSVDIHITYIGTANVGDVIEIIGTTDRVGQSLGFTDVTVTMLVDGKPGMLVGRALHTKYIWDTMMENQAASLGRKEEAIA